LFDNREQYDKDFRPEHLVKYFENVNLRAEQCFITIGDALWVAEDRKSKERFCLDYILERKSVADLSGSITSGRYIRQKYRLDKCGLEKVMYLVEGNIERDFHLEERQKLAVKSALIETDIHDDIYMLRTESLEKTKKLYVDLTRSIQDLYNPRVGRDKAAPRAFFANCLPTFNAFHENMKNFVASESTVQNTWGVMLAQVKGMGPDSAEAIVNLYPTPISLYETFNRLNWDESRCVDLIAQIQPKERRIGRSAAQNFYEAFFK
jgi:crossover junction endonuclease MUS81